MVTKGKPNSMRVMGKNYKVLHLDLKGKGGDGMDLYGDLQYRTNLIRVEKSLCRDQMTDSLIHEALHAIDDSLCIGLKEKQIRAISAFVLDIISENPHIFGRKR